MHTRRHHGGVLDAARSDDPRVSDVLGARQAYLAVAGSRGPHVTPMLFARVGGRLWFLVGRTSLTGRIVRRASRAGVTLSAGNRSLVMLGNVRVLDPVLPLRGTAGIHELVSSPVAAGAYASRNLPEALGYLRDACAMLEASVMPGDVLLTAFVPGSIALLEGERVTGSWGAWPGSPRPVSAVGSTPPPRSAKLRLESPEGVPPEAAPLVGRATRTVVGWTSPGGPVAVPARWDARSGRARLPAALLGLANAPATSSASVVFDVAKRPGPTGKSGLVLRGEGAIAGTESDRWLALEPDRVTYWVGPRTGTVDLGREDQRRSTAAS